MLNDEHFSDIVWYDQYILDFSFTNIMDTTIHLLLKYLFDNQ